MIYNAIKSLVVLIEKLAFFNKQLYGVYCILNTLTANYEYSRSNGRIYRHQFKCSYLNDQKIFASF